MSFDSHPVLGSAPISTNRAAVGTVSVEPETESLRTRCSRRPSPPPSITRVLKRTSMFPAACISVIRYSDILAASEQPRITSVTFKAYLYRSGLLMSQRIYGLHPPGETGELP